MPAFKIAFTTTTPKNAERTMWIHHIKHRKINDFTYAAYIQAGYLLEATEFLTQRLDKNHCNYTLRQMIIETWK